MKQNKAKEILDSLSRSSEKDEFFVPIKIGSYGISIQASERHYSRPKKTLNNSKDYDAFEVALIDYGSERWIRPKRDHEFKSFEWSKMFEDNEHPVAPYVSRGDVEKIIVDLMELCKKRMN